MFNNKYSYNISTTLLVSEFMFIWKNWTVYSCPLQAWLSILSWTWKWVIIWFMLSEDSLSFSDLRKKVYENTRVSITDKMLSQTLKQLINLNIIEKISVENKKRYKISIMWIKLKPVMYELEKFWENLIK